MGDELADLHTFFLSLLRALVGETVLFAGRVSLGDRRCFEGEKSRVFGESKLTRRAGLTASLAVALLDTFEVTGVFAMRDGLLAAAGGFCLFTAEHGDFDTFGLLLALIKREPPPAVAHFDTLSNMLMSNHEESDSIRETSSSGRYFR